MAEAKQFLPLTRAEMKVRGWDELDVLIITGDAYIDHPAFGAAEVTCGEYIWKRASVHVSKDGHKEPFK